jgi:hypothetical protein
MSRAHFPRLRMLVCTLVVSAWASGAVTLSAQQAATPQQAVEPLKIAQIACIQPEDGKETPCELGSLLQVRLESTQPLIKRQRSLDTLLLVVNGLPFEHVTARVLDESGNKLRFKLDPRLDPGQWKALYAGQDAHADFYVALAVREPGNLAAAAPVLTLVSNAVTTRFRVRPDYRWAIYAGLALLVIVVIYLARATPLLRDAGKTAPGALRPYSLARTQLAAWTVTIIGSYLFIWAVLGNTDPLNNTALILMGLSALTGVAASIVDNKPAPPKPAPAPAPAPPAPDAQAPPPAPAPAPAPAAGVPVTDPPASVNFVTDILSDKDGVSIYRFQMAVWTLVLIVVFLYTVWNTLAMPDFSEVLLGLMGISNGTYVGMKQPATAS